MKLKEIYECADGLAPFSLSEEMIKSYGHYDNSGVMLDCGGEIKGVLFSLDLSLAAVQEAKKRELNCIFTHHPAIWEGLKHITKEDAPALFSCVKEGICVLSAHLNLDAAPGGIDESLMEALGGTAPSSLMEPLSQGGYGRVYDLPERPLAEFAEKAGKALSTSRILVYGDRPVKRVASFCGAGLDNGSLAFVLGEGADTLVSSDGKHHLLAEGLERGLNFVLLTHYAAEAYGFGKFFSRMKEKLSVPAFFFGDGRMM